MSCSLEATVTFQVNASSIYVYFISSRLDYPVADTEVCGVDFFSSSCGFCFGRLQHCPDFRILEKTCDRAAMPHARGISSKHVP